MLHALKRHPFPVSATLEHCLVLAYAVPAEELTPLLPPGLVLDRFARFGILALAMVETKSLRPACLPATLGFDFFLAGVRIFVRHKTEQRTLRGLRILRSYTDSRLMAGLGNALTHYNYRIASVRSSHMGSNWTLQCESTNAQLDLTAHLDVPTLPAGRHFGSTQQARRFAGPLPFTFDYEPETNSIVRIEGVRDAWNPPPVSVDVHCNTFLQPFAKRDSLRLASAFYMKDVPYLWKRGIREQLPEAL